MNEQNFYTTNNTIDSFCTKESIFTNEFISKDSVDACFDGNEKLITCLNSSNVVKNGSQKQSFRSTITLGNTENEEKKSFIQQRVERLYGPGALAQGFFVMKRQRNQLTEFKNDTKGNKNTDIKHSNTITDELVNTSSEEFSNKHTSSVLPVLRHLRPEFRDQLLVIKGRKNPETIHKINSALKDEANIEEISPQITNIIQIQIDPAVEDSDVKDGHYFLKILNHETSRLLKLADEYESLLTKSSDLQEDAIGVIRSASGKARLLVSQKMKQFKGLCTNNINQVEGETFPTTSEDLQGFWDMVMLQVKQVDTLFQDIDRLKENNWKEIEPVKPLKVVTNRLKPRKTAVSNGEACKQREAREIERKRLIEEKRKAMKAQNKQKGNIEIFVPDSS